MSGLADRLAGAQRQWAPEEAFLTTLASKVKRNRVEVVNGLAKQLDQPEQKRQYRKAILKLFEAFLEKDRGMIFKILRQPDLFTPYTLGLTHAFHITGTEFDVIAGSSIGAYSGNLI